MKTALEITKIQLNSDAHNRSLAELIPIEDARFRNFTNLLDEIDVFKNPLVSRGSGKYKQGLWSLLGYSTSTYRQDREDDEDEIYQEEEPLEQQKLTNKTFDIKWEYTLFNGIFTSETKIEKATKQEIEKLIKETERFIEMTLSRSLINDVNEVRDLQEQLLEQNSNSDLVRLDICIITDKEIGDLDKFSNKILIESLDLECRIYFWDIRRWDAMKRSKSKREPINIDFTSDDYKFYNVPYLMKETGTNLDYILSIFPGDLIADLYDLHSTRILENNVRVFLSTNRSANKEMQKTINDMPINFFSFNNGISATAELVEVKNGFINKIENFQIVNGGQTTATLHYCRKIQKPSASLRNVFVAVKITALKKDDNYSKIVNKISSAANSQTAISKSDFYTNNPKLIIVERLSLNTPTQNKNDRNVYFFFERMKGQYNVLRSSQGTKSQQNLWESNFPQKLTFDKLDLARWVNMMNELPHLVAEGAQKQFEYFIKSENSELHVGSYKYVVGFGMLFRRIYKLCGTAQGKKHLYPSRILDLKTNQHVPVAASTAIYAASYFHLITKGRMDYWAIFNFEFNLCNSLLNPTDGKGDNMVRINSELDEILEVFIDEIWKSIAFFGGAATQEKSKKVECWNFIRKDVQIPKVTLNALNGFLISDSELERRISNQSIDDDYKYFNSLNILLGNNGSILNSLFSISCRNNEFTQIKYTINNFIKKIKNKKDILSFKKVEEIFSFYENLISEGYALDEEVDSLLDQKIDIDNIYQIVFKNKEFFLENLNKALLNDALDDEYENLNENLDFYNDVKEAIDNYYISYGISVHDLLSLSNVISKFGKS